MEFWKNAKINVSTGTVDSVIQGTKVMISEEVIREVLQFGDSLDAELELYVPTVRRALFTMGYEGKYPPTSKKIMPPFWLTLFLVASLAGRVVLMKLARLHLHPWFHWLWTGNTTTPSLC